MKIGSLSLALVISSLALAFAGFGRQEVAAQITFVQAPRNPNQTQNQRGLPPEKKRSLSRFGPEDVFPGVNEQEESSGRNSTQRQSSRRASVSRSAPAPRLSPTPAATPVTTPSPSATQAATPEPGPTIVASLAKQFQPPPAHQSSSTQSASPWAVPVLSGLALIVSIALAYVLTRLIEKIREDSHV